MEVIRIAGYTEDEKLNIATRYLIPKQILQNGLKEKEMNIIKRSYIQTLFVITHVKQAYGN